MKIYAKSDASGDIIAFHLTGAKPPTDVTSRPCPTSDPTFSAAPSSATKASQQGQPGSRQGARGRSSHFPQGQRKNKPAFFARTLYKARARIEQGVGWLKRFKRVALRCEKTARNFGSIVSFAAGLCVIKFVHTP
jgi:transposase